MTPPPWVGFLAPFGLVALVLAVAFFAGRRER